ncbi:MAG: hypothetical protein CL693_17215 [Cellvibrionaceae bacterium]|nr:hypothetical protein [Cellvibrionaceae bacterium]|tara:strand:- start:23435 stop:24019 length:585 start_codon:yes stop_codon:yes gene_type:complete
MISIPGLNCEAALNRLDGNLSLYFRLVEKYITGQAGIDRAIRANANMQDKTEAIRLTHSLKGLSAGLGAEVVTELSAQLEQGLKGGGDCTSLIDQLECELESTVSNLKQALVEYEDFLVIAVDDLESLVPVPDTLKRVQVLLAASDVEAIELLERLSLHRDASDLKSVLKLARDYKFDEALESFIEVSRDTKEK